MKHFTRFLALMIIVPALFSQETLRERTLSDTLFLNVIIPEDTVITVSSAQRIAANTHPANKAFINGVETKVHPTGAFVGRVTIPVGENTLTLKVVNPVGDSLTRVFRLIRPEPISTSPVEPEQFDTLMREPSTDLWLADGDELEVKAKGSPGMNLVFDIEGLESGIEMQELNEKEAGGLKGVYVGKFRVRPGMETENAEIRFRMNPWIFGSTKAYAKGRVSVIPDRLPRVGEVKGTRPFLSAGLGTDRLGGARLGYIQPSVKLLITGKRGSLYRVQLSPTLTAYIPQAFITLLPEHTDPPRSLVGSVSVTGNGREDVVSVSLDQRLPWVTSQQMSPATIIVDIYGATSNTNWITHHLSATEVVSAQWEQVAEGHYRLILPLRSGAHWGHTIEYQGTTMRIVVRKPPVIADKTRPLAGITVAIDAGHGGGNQGALGATGAREKDLNLSMARHLDTLVRNRGGSTVMIRENDKEISMSERMENAVRSGAHLFVSIHCNSIGAASDPDRTKGTSTYYRHIGYKAMADFVYDELLTLGLAQFGVIGSFNFALNYLHEVPNVLAEIAFISHPEDELKLLDDGFRKRVAERIADGLGKYLLSQQTIK